MSKSISISLSDDQAQFVQSQIETGHYGSVSEVVEAGLRLMKAERDFKIARLRKEINKGLDSGSVTISEHKVRFAEMRCQALADSEIDTSDIPVMSDEEWARAKKYTGRFYKPSKKN